MSSLKPKKKNKKSFSRTETDLFFHSSHVAKFVFSFVFVGLGSAENKLSKRDVIVVLRHLFSSSRFCNAIQWTRQDAIVYRGMRLASL